MPQIDRKASVIFSDADIVIRETRQRMPYNEEQAWETQFKRQVFHRIVQTLNRLGWTCVVPEKDWTGDDPYGHRDRMRKMERECRKGDLSGELRQRGATITFQMFQNVNAPNRPDHGGRYEFNKEAIMPYLLRLEMERTRRKIRDYLCNVFSGYYFDVEWMEKHGRHQPKPGGLTAVDAIIRHYDNSSHFKGRDWEAYKAQSYMSHNIKSADGQLLDHGQLVWFADSKGRWLKGRALYNINNMWWVVTGLYSYTNKACFELHANQPEDLHGKRNDKLRRQRLESELNSAISRMDFRRAETLRDLLWPPGEPIFCLWHREHEAYHRQGFSGYAREQMDAGKFTRAELAGWEDSTNVIVPFGRRP